MVCLEGADVFFQSDPRRRGFTPGMYEISNGVCHHGHRRGLSERHRPHEPAVREEHLGALLLVVAQYPFEEVDHGLLVGIGQ